ncbi:MAG TPA: hypothetical protein VHX86_08225, partial [Tepidisphaeraceae bacterium]|nr:hypothetical protein [Tepidisphaeraceae bacterium]
MLRKLPNKKRRRSARRALGHAIEPLEGRLLLSADVWNVDSSGSWSTGADWSTGVVPNSTSAVVINQPGNIQVTLTGNASVSSLSVTGDTLSVSGGTLSIAGTSTLGASGALAMSSTATVALASGAALTNYGAITVAPGGLLSVGGLYSQTSTGTLTLTSGSVGAGVGTNLLNNGDFEQPSAGSSTTTAPSDWSNWNSTYVSTSYAYTGSQSLLESGSNSGVNQSFAATPGVSYSASVYAFTPSSDKLSGPEGAFLNILFYNSSGTQLNAAGDSLTVLNSNSAAGGTITGSEGGTVWNNFTTTTVAPANAVKVTFALQVGAYTGLSGTAGGEVYWDDAQFGVAAVTSAKVSAASVSNSGTMSIGLGGVVSASGSFTQSSSGVLNILLGGPPVTGLFGTLNAATASLGGTLKASLVNSYSPSLNDSFNLIAYSSESGTFSNFQLPSGSSYAFEPTVSPTYVGISAVPPTLTTTVNIASSTTSSTDNLVGVNVDWWDDLLTTSETQSMIEAAGLSVFRFPGGSSSDDYHFNQSSNNGDPSANTIVQFAEFIQAVGGTGIITTDYGSGSPQEAEAELAYLEGSPSDTTVIGNGQEWNDSTGEWQTVNWLTVGYWADLRASTPAQYQTWATADGDYNSSYAFLAIDEPTPFTQIKYWEIGNEQYGNWEIDHYAPSGTGGYTTSPYNYPQAYAQFAATFASFVKADQANLPSILIGIDSGDPSGASDNNWTKNVLTDGEALGFVPGFISDHSYMYGPGDENDSVLLNDTVTDPNSILDWTTRYNDYESLLDETVGSSAAAGVKIMATEYNSNYGTPGKQMTSLVNGLFVAESIGSLLNSGYSAGVYWDLRNGWGTTGNNSPSLYGWREGGDEGLIGNSGDNDPPSTGPYIAYPDYFAEELASKIMQNGGVDVSTTSNYSELGVYSVLESDGHLDLLVINDNPDASLTEQFTLSGFTPSGQAQFWQYGEAQDYAQSQSATGAASLANFSTNLSFNGDSFSYAFPAYSMTVIDLTPTPTVTTPAAADPNPVTGTTTNLSAAGSENDSGSGLNYTWSATSVPNGVAAPTYSVNGTNAAASTIATFFGAGNYSFLVTITDASNNSTTSSVNVTVQQTPTGVMVTPNSATVAVDGTQQFSASATDQFGNDINSPTFNWSIAGVSDGNSIDDTGLATLGSTLGTYTVTAALGSASNTAQVTVAATPTVSSFQVNDGN